jgi:hypothetical protein
MKLEEAPPSQQVVAKAMQTVIVSDSAGRKLTLRKPGVLSQYRLIEVIGESNERYINMVLPIIFLAEIDGDPVGIPTKKSEVEALLQRLDDHGIKALTDGLVEHFVPATPEADKIAVKK